MGFTAGYRFISIKRRRIVKTVRRLFQKKQKDFVKREFREVLFALWRWDGSQSLLTPSTVCGLLPPLRRSPSLEEGGLGASPVKASGLAVDWI